MPVYCPGFSARRRSLLKGLGALGVGLSFMSRHSFSAEEKKLNFYNWDTYIGDTTLADFETATGIAVKMDLFADNDELFAKLKAGNPGYDVIVPTNDNLERMIKANMVMPLDMAKLPNFKNLDAVFQDAAFDPGRKHSVPYLWGTVGIGFRKSKVEGAIDSWKVLFEDPKYAGRLALLDDAKIVIGSALKYLGQSLNSTDPAVLKKVEELLIAGKKNVKVFAKDNGQDLLASGDVDLTMEYNGDILQVMTEDDDLSYVVPTEGAEMWQDCLAIPTGAPRPENAHAFINFIMDPQTEAGIAKTVQYATPNAEAKKLMDKAYLENPAIFPPAEVVAKCEPALYLGEDVTKSRDEVWTRVKAA